MYTSTIPSTDGYLKYASPSKDVRIWLRDRSRDKKRGNIKNNVKDGLEKSINSRSKEDYMGIAICVPERAHTTQCLSAGYAP